MTTAEQGRQTRYRFGPLERRGLVAGWRGGQIALVAGGLLHGVVIVRARSSPLGAAMAVVVLAGAATAATWPLGGRTAEEWAPHVARFALVVARRKRTEVHFPLSMSRLSRPQKSAHGPFAPLRLLPVPIDGTPACADGEPFSADGELFSSEGERFFADEEQSVAGIVHDSAARTYTAVLDVQSCGFVLVGQDQQTARVAGWSGILAALAREGSPVHRVQWVVRCLPDSGAEMRRYVAARSVLGADTPAGRSYNELLFAVDAITPRHATWLALSVHAGRSARAIRAAGGGERGACTVLLREVAALQRRLSDAEIETDGLLSPRVLARVLRRPFLAERAGAWSPDFEDRPVSDGRRPARDLSIFQRPGPQWSCPKWPWPMATELSWGRLRSDATWRATYWIAEWPRIDVGADFLGPLLLLSDVRRTVSVTMEPLSPRKAVREIEQARTADVADAELRRRGGFLSTARRQREEAVLSRREEELADGHAQLRFLGLRHRHRRRPRGARPAVCPGGAGGRPGGRGAASMLWRSVARLHVLTPPRARARVTGRKKMGRLPVHQATTRNLGALYPFLSEPGLGGRGVLIGRDLLGGAFVHDPFELYRQGVVTNLGVVRWLQSSWKLSRAWGIANVAVLHRLSDLTAAGSADSEQVRLAEGLLADSETRVVYAQAAGEVERAGELLGLSSTELELVPRLHRGVALWKVGSRSFLVRHMLAPSERAIVDTDQRMVPESDHWQVGDGGTI